MALEKVDLFFHLHMFGKLEQHVNLPFVAQSCGANKLMATIQGYIPAWQPHFPDSEKFSLPCQSGQSDAVMPWNDLTKGCSSEQTIA